jgi:polyisoprenoid-binding protein YceI
MKFRSLFFLAALALALPACKSEINDQPAAQVSETTATTADTAATTGTEANANATTAQVIKEKSSIQFVGAKVTRDHNGQFRSFDGSIRYVQGRPQDVSFTIDVGSLETDDPNLDKHLKTPDFFDVAKFPQAKFTSTSLTEAPAGSPDGATHVLRGTLDLHGVQKEITVPVNTQQTPEGVRTTSNFTINRHDWGISYKGMADDLIKDNVLIKLDLYFPPPPTA